METSLGKITTQQQISTHKSIKLWNLQQIISTL